MGVFLKPIELQTMSLVGKLESEIEVNAPAHRFYQFFKHEISHVVNVCPNLIKKIKVHNGDWKDHCHGSIKVWNYVVGMYNPHQLHSLVYFLSMTDLVLALVVVI